jgi:peptidoglycan/xylan/chitin deacetylase (PgdA/CDA1 family)
MATLIMGYDVEFLAIGENLARAGIPDAVAYPTMPQDATERGLELIRRAHREFDAPATLFVCGRTLTHALPALLRAHEEPLFDFGQHTYSHVLFKDDHWEGGVFRASPPEALVHEVQASSALLEEHLGITCLGMRTPHGYWRGLRDRPDLLEIVEGAGLRYISSWGRNEDGGNPTPLEIQPFWYEEEGYEHILEIPFQFWLDGTWFPAHGNDRGRDFLRALEGAVDHIVEHDLAYGVCFHDWAMLHYDEERTKWVWGLLEHARRRGVEIVSYTQYYQSQAALAGAAR